MKRLFCSIVVGILATSIVYSLPAYATTDVEGAITENTTWNTDQDPYLVKGDVQVLQTLTIEAGVQVEIRGDYRIDVAGKLVVEGVEGNPVVFDCINNDRSCWKGIRFAETQSGSDIEGLVISGADTAIDTNVAPWSIQDSYLHDNVLAADLEGVVNEPSGTFDHNYVDDNATGVKVAAGVRSFDLNTIMDNDTGVSFWTTEGTYSGNNIEDNEDLNATTCDVPGTGEVDATENWWGSSSETTIKAKLCDGSLEAHPNATIDYVPFAEDEVAGAATLEYFEPAPSPSPSPSLSTPPPPPPPVEHGRDVSLRLRRHLRARGVVTVHDGYLGCVPTSVTIRYKRRAKATWTVIRRPAVDPANNTYATKLRDRPGIYRTRIQQSATDTDICLAASSAKVRHRH